MKLKTATDYTQRLKTYSDSTKLHVNIYNNWQSQDKPFSVLFKLIVLTLLDQLTNFQINDPMPKLHRCLCKISKYCVL